MWKCFVRFTRIIGSQIVFHDWVQDSCHIYCFTMYARRRVIVIPIDLWTQNVKQPYNFQNVLFGKEKLVVWHTVHRKLFPSTKSNWVSNVKYQINVHVCTILNYQKKYFTEKFDWGQLELSSSEGQLRSVEVVWGQLRSVKVSWDQLRL